MPWSPLSALKRVDADTYEMWDGQFRVAIIKHIQIWNPYEKYWRSVSGDEQTEDRQLLGYFPTIEFAATVTWRSWVQHKTKPVERHHL